MKWIVKKSVRGLFPLIPLAAVVSALVQPLFAQSSAEVPAVVRVSKTARPAVSPVSAALIPACSSPTDGSGDGVPRNDGGGDGNPIPIALAPWAITTDQPDLAISQVGGNLETSAYSLSYCVVNRGGKPAFSPVAIRAQAGPISLFEVTIFQSIPSLTGVCLEIPMRSPVPPKAEMLNATIEVAGATGETAALNNKCRVQWVTGR